MFHLRELERKDLPAINKWRNDPELIELLGAPFRYINLDVDIKWYESYMGNRGSAVRCAITEDDKDEILGLVSLVSINYMNQSAEFHIMIGDTQNQGRGIGTFAVQSMLNHAFNNMNLQRVELTVLEDNIRAKHLYEKCGFVYEGRKRKAKYKNGKFVDMLMYSILRSEFQGGVRETKLPTWCVDTTSNRNYISSIIKVCDKAFAEPVAERTIYIDLLQKIYRNGIFVFAYQKEPIAYCAFYANDADSKSAYISLIAVRPEYQHAHVGKQLLEYCMGMAIDRGMKYCTLEVKKNNDSAIRFYKANGFVFLSERESSFFMKKELRSQEGKTYEYQRKESNSSRNGKAGL